jgi:ankyrin repeat protein
LWAFEHGREVLVKAMLECKADINSKDSFDRTPLSHAASNEHEAVVRLLLTIGMANIDSKNRNGRAPLSLAAGRGHEAVVKLLLESKADADSKDIKGRTPLW